MPGGERDVSSSWHPSPADYPDDDTALMTRLRAGDDTALSEIHQRHVRAVHLLVRGQLDSEADAEEVTQSAFLLLWRRCRRIDLVGSSCLPWLLVAAQAQVRSVSRHARRSGPAGTEGGSAAEREERRELARQRALQRVSPILATLSAADQEVFDLCVAGGLSYKKGAHRVRSGYPAAGDRFSRVRRSLRNRRGW